MRGFWKLFAWIGVFAAVPAVAAPDYSNVYVYGDSLVDSGNAWIGTGFTEAPLDDGYFYGRFSNGLNFADYLSQALVGHVATPLLGGGVNVAVGGATANPFLGGASPSFLAQVLAYGPKSIPNDALVLVTFGGNDVRATYDVNGSVDFSATAAYLLSGLNTLAGYGARNFVVVGSPDIGLIPEADGQAATTAELTQRSIDISALFANVAAVLDNVPGIDAQFFDLFGFEHALLANAQAFGLPANLNTTDQCQTLGAGIPQSCEGYLYFDDKHPTTQIHAAIASGIYGQLAANAALPEPATWMIVVLGFGTLGAALRRSRSGRAAAAA